MKHIQIKPFQLTGGATGLQVPSRVESASVSSQGFRLHPNQVRIPLEEPHIDKVGDVVDAKALQELNSTLFKSALQVADIVSTRNAKELSYKYQIGAEEILQGDTGYLKLSGKTAYEGKELAFDKLKQLKNDLLSSASSDVKVKSFSALQNIEEKYRTIIGSHALREFKQWDADVKDLGLASVVSDSVSTMDDPVSVVEKITAAADSLYPRNADGSFDAETKTARIAFINNAKAQVIEAAYRANIDDPSKAGFLADTLASSKFNMGDDYYVDYNRIGRIIANGEQQAHVKRNTDRREKAQQRSEQKRLAIDQLGQDKESGDTAKALMHLDVFTRAGVINSLEKDHYKKLILGKTVDNKNPVARFGGDYYKISAELDNVSSTAELNALRETIIQDDNLDSDHAKPELLARTMSKQAALQGSARAMGVRFIQDSLAPPHNILSQDDKDIFSAMQLRTVAEYEPMIRKWVSDGMSASDIVDRLQRDKVSISGLTTFDPYHLAELKIEDIETRIDGLHQRANELDPIEYNQELKKLQYQLSIRKDLVSIDKSVDMEKIDPILAPGIIKSVVERNSLPNILPTFHVTPESAQWFDSYTPVSVDAPTGKIIEETLYDSPTMVRKKVDSIYKNGLTRQQKNKLTSMVVNVPGRKQAVSATREIDRVLSGTRSPKKKKALSKAKQEIIKSLEYGVDKEEAALRIKVIMDSLKGL